MKNFMPMPSSHSSPAQKRNKRLFMRLQNVPRRIRPEGECSRKERGETLSICTGKREEEGRRAIMPFTTGPVAGLAPIRAPARN